MGGGVRCTEVRNVAHGVGENSAAAEGLEKG